MADCSLATLQAQACANGFLDLDQKAAKTVLLQLLCNITGGESSGETECVNLIPTGKTYNDTSPNGNFNLYPYVSIGSTYDLIWGANEVSADINGQLVLNPGIGHTTQFTEESSPGGGGWSLSLNGTGPNISVTATLCKI